MHETQKRFWILFCITLIIINCNVWYIVFSESTKNVLTISFLDIGQGDAIFIETPNGNQILIDGGAGAQILRALGSVMPFYDRHIDMIIATHPDTDHIGGLPDVLERYEVDYILQSGVVSQSPAYKALQKMIEERSVVHIVAKRGMQFALDTHISLSVLFPDRDVSKLEPNTASIVTQLVYEKTSFLFTGDSPIAVEKYLVEIDNTNLKSDVLKIGHHGSKTSTSEVFIETIKPQYAIISLGKDNSFGHPHEEVIATLNNAHVAVFRTDQQGTVMFESNGEKIMHID